MAIDLKGRVPERYRRLYRKARYQVKRKLGKVYLLSESQDRLMRNIALEADRYIAEHQIHRTKCVLFPSSYLQVYFNRVIDFFLPVALSVRGAYIVPILCDGFHKVQCPIFAGEFITHWLNDFDTQCRQYCKDPARILWQCILGYKPLTLKSYLRAGDVETAKRAVDGIDRRNYLEYDYDGYDLGFQTAECVANNNNLGRVLPGEPFAFEMNLHAKNAVLMLLAYDRLVKELRPDVVVGTFHDHYQWSTLYHVARKAGISYYSYMMIDKKGAVYFGKDVRTACEVTGAWPTFRDTPVDPETWRRFDAFVEAKADGGTTHFGGYYPSRGAKELEELKSRLDPGKPVVFFPVNVPWDNAIHNFCFVAKDVIEMIEKTVRFFNRHLEYQLIIKSHPMEQNFTHFDYLPHTLRQILVDMGEPLGSNVFFVDADSPISSFDLYGMTDLGIVHSSRSGCELAMNGKLVILAADNHYRGKGFTIDVSSETEFYNAIVTALASPQSPHEAEKRRRLARKYWLLYGFHGFVGLNLFDEGWTKPPELLFRSLHDLLPGQNQKLDYICDAILQGEPVFGDLRWPPLSI